MTENNNPLTNRNRPIGQRPEAYIQQDGVMIPCAWDIYVAWMNENNQRDGEYVTVVVAGRRTLEYRPQGASDGWLRERGITPPSDRRGQAHEIGYYTGERR